MRQINEILLTHSRGFALLKIPAYINPYPANVENIVSS